MSSRPCTGPTSSPPSGPVDRLVHALTDPVSGQPDLKGTPVRVTAITEAWRGALLRLDGGEPELSSVDLVGQSRRRSTGFVFRAGRLDAAGTGSSFRTGAAPAAAHSRRGGADLLFRSAPGDVPLCRHRAGPAGGLRVLRAARRGACRREQAKALARQGDFTPMRTARAAGWRQRERREGRAARSSAPASRSARTGSGTPSATDGLTSRRPDRSGAEGRHQLRLLHSRTEETAGPGSATAGGKPMTISPACLDGTLPTVAEALALVAPHSSPIAQSEQIALDHAVGRILACDVTAPITMPPFPRAAMDGFAFRSGSGAPLQAGWERRPRERPSAAAFSWENASPFPPARACRRAAIPSPCASIAARSRTRSGSAPC